MGLPRLTIGIEEEYQIIDPETRELTSYIHEFIEQGRVVLQDQIKPEFMQSQVEAGSHICHNIKEVRQEIVRLRRTVSELAEVNGLHRGPLPGPCRQADQVAPEQPVVALLPAPSHH